MIFRKVNPDEVGKLAEMYDEVLDRQPFDEYGPKWTRGIDPCQQDYISHCSRGEFHAGEDNKAGNWRKRVSDEEVAVIHLLAVAPSYRGQGTAMSFLKYLTEQAGKKARVIHLDVLDGNLAAGRLYLKQGFTYSGNLEAYYEDIGECLINLYEFDLEK